MAPDEHPDDLEADEPSLEDPTTDEPTDDENDVEGFMMPTIKPAGSGILDGLLLPAVKPANQVQQQGLRSNEPGGGLQSNEPLLADGG